MADSPAPSDEESPVTGTPRRDGEIAARTVSAGVAEDNVPGLLRAGYALAVRHFAALAAPAALLYVPAAIVAWVAVTAAVGRGGRIVNGAVTVWTYSPALVAVLAAVAVAGFAVEILVVAASTIMAAGALLGRPVEAGAAVRAAARRAPALAVLGLIMVLVTAGGTAAGAVTAARTGAVWLGVVVIVAVALALLWLAVALPIALLEGRGPLGAIARAGTLTRYRRWQTSIALAVGAVIVPGLAGAGLSWSTSLLDGIVHTLAGQVVFVAAGVVAVPFQAATLVVVALNQRYPYRYGGTDERPIDVGAAADLLAAVPRRRRAPRLPVPWPIALVPLPGLLLAGYVWVNPLDLLRTSDHVLRDDFGRQPVMLHLLGGDRPVELSGPIAESFGIRVCATDACHGSRLHDYRDARYAIKMGTATLPDGTIAVAAWSPARGNESTRKDGEWVLRLFRCGVHECGTRQAITTAPVVEHGGALEMFAYGVGATAAAGRGIVIAAIEPSAELKSGVSRDSLLRIIRCADVRCAKPATVTATRLPFRILGLYSRPVAVAVGRGDRPVVAYEDKMTGGLTMVSCDAAACAHPRVTRENPPPLPESRGPDPYVDGVDIAVPPDDRPIVTQRDGRTGTALLRRCRTPGCAQTDTVRLTGPGQWRPWPALELDRAGRPVVATYDLDRHHTVLIACHDSGCARRTQVVLGRFEQGPGYLDLAIGRDGDPRVLWSDQPQSLFFSSGPLHLTICRDPRCHP
jgi:hypothetical protein